MCGAGGALQARINGQLGVRLHDGIAAAAISFGTGLALMCLLAAALPAGRRGVAGLLAAVRTRRLRWWQCLGGLAGAAYVTSQGVSAVALGVAAFTVAVVGGQTASSLAVDRLGLGPAPPQPVSAARVSGAVLAVLAVAVAVGAGPAGGRPVLALALLPAVSGVLLSWQAAVNGRVGQAAGGVLPAILLNFVTGTAGLLVAFGIDLAVRGPTGPLPTEPVLYTGGLFGVVFIAMAVTVVRYTGVLLLGLATIGGQVCGAVAIDLVSPPPGGRPGPYTLAGAALTLVAVAVAAAARRPTRA